MERVEVIHGDCREALRDLRARGTLVDAVVTDPPYHLTSIVKRFGADGAKAPAPKTGEAGAYARSARGFMGKTWDGGDVAFQAETWRAVLSVCRPGAHLVAFGGTRGWHRMAAAIEDAGFEIRDTLMWLYGTGFPKSHNLEGAHEGWGTALKPAVEPIVLARKPLAGTVAETVARHGTGALNIDGCRIAPASDADIESQRRVVGFNVSYSNGEASSVLSGGADGSLRRRDRVEFDPTRGRWPANVLHDGSAEVVAAFPEAPGAASVIRGTEASAPTRNVFGTIGRIESGEPRADAGSAARFFYSAKADGAGRLGSRHPTIKPVDLMQWLCRLVTPPGGLVLDPFAGSGTTGAACLREGFRAILVEREAEYVADINRRLAFERGEGRHSIVEKATARDREDHGPLFGGAA